LTIPAKSRTAADGTLHLDVATGLPDAEVEVVVIVERVGAKPQGRPADRWPEGFFELYGSLRDSGLERPPQLPVEEREGLELPSRLVPTFLIPTPVFNNSRVVVRRCPTGCGGSNLGRCGYVRS